MSRTSSSRQRRYWVAIIPVTVYGRDVNVNAITAQNTNVVQDYALVVSVGEGEEPTAISSVSFASKTSNPTGDQTVTDISGTNQVLVNQFVGANTVSGNQPSRLGEQPGMG